MFLGVHPKGVCGIRRIPSDEVTIEKNPKNISPGVLLKGGCYSSGVCYLPCYMVVIFADRGLSIFRRSFESA